MREINNINFSITNICNINCKDCSYNSPNKSKTSLSLNDIEKYSKFFQGYKINITEGEPTCHPDFTKIVSKLRKLFKPKFLSIETNGYGFTKFPDYFVYFDIVHYSLYNKQYFGFSNEDALKYMQKHYPYVTISVHKINNHTLRTNKGQNMCDKGISETVAFMDGKIYPCCIGNGFDGAIGIEPCNNWEDKIHEINIPCNNCFLAK